MREDSARTSNHLHWHDGATCHGDPTADECARYAVESGWVGKVLEKVDTYWDGTEVKCYTLVASRFDHYVKLGTYVMEVKIVAVPIPVTVQDSGG